MKKILIRALQEKDMPFVFEIEKQQFLYGWNEQQIKEYLTKPFQAVVMIADGEIVGWAAFSMVADECEIHNIIISTAQRQQGYGGLLLNYLIELAKKGRVRRIFLEVRASNNAALAFYDKFGFQRYGVRNDYYRAAEKNENAILMRYEL